MDKPLVNSWTEFGDLETVCVGVANSELYPEFEPFYVYDQKVLKKYDDFITLPIGPRPLNRLQKAAKELDGVKAILEAECVTVKNVTEFEEDIKEDLKRKRTFVASVKSESDDIRIKKNSAKVIRPPYIKVNQPIQTPWFKNDVQFGFACPRDVVITMGNTVLESPNAARGRYFESYYFRDIIYDYFNADRNIHWKAAPRPTCSDSMLHYVFDDKRPPSEKRTGSALNEKEVAFDAADMMRVGKDIFYKRSASANYKGVDWLRREFPDLRFHVMHFRNDFSRHIDVNLSPMRPPTSGSDGIVLINKLHPPPESELQIFKDNDWKVIYGPKPATNKVTPVALCSPSLNMNFLSLSPTCCLIEECEIELYNLLEDLGFDVITCQLRTLNEFGGGPHCVTWDIRRDDSLVDYFPNQNYEQELAIDYNESFGGIEQHLKPVHTSHRIDDKDLKRQIK